VLTIVAPTLIPVDEGDVGASILKIIYPVNEVISVAGLAVFAIGLIWLGYILQSERDAPPRWGVLMLALGLFLALGPKLLFFRLSPRFFVPNRLVEFYYPGNLETAYHVSQVVCVTGLWLCVAGLLWLGHALWSGRSTSDLQHS
jgi:hypothetical protein